MEENKEQYKYNSVQLAKYIVAAANERRISINMTKIQKLLYIAYGIFLAVKSTRLMDEHPQAWPYGPVFPTTRNKLLKVDLFSINFGEEELTELKNDSELQSLIDLVFKSFGNWNALQLTEWSHGDGTPWQQTVSMNNFSWGMRIPDDSIKRYFSSIIKFSPSHQNSKKLRKIKCIQKNDLCWAWWYTSLVLQLGGRAGKAGSM